MTKTALLHIGTPKTGTTSIQKCLADAHWKGTLGTVAYPLQRDEIYHWRVAALYLPYEEWTPWMRLQYPTRQEQRDSKLDRYRRFLFDELRSASGAVISAEHFSTLLSAPRAAVLRKDLESLGFEEFHVVLYVRDPADYYLSRVQQLLKGPSATPFIEDTESFKYDFRGMAETWEQVFPGRLIVRNFPKDPHHDVIDDFAALLEEHLGVALTRVPTRENTSVSAEGMQILQDYRGTFCPDHRVLTSDAARLIEFLERSVQDLPQTKPLLKEELAARIRANHKADADEIYARYGVDLDFRSVDSAVKTLPSCSSYRVEDIVESVDPEIVHRLLLRLARTELDGNTVRRSLVRVATKAYRRGIPRHIGPAALEAKVLPYVDKLRRPGI